MSKSQDNNPNHNRNAYHGPNHKAVLNPKAGVRKDRKQSLNVAGLPRVVDQGRANDDLLPEDFDASDWSSYEADPIGRPNMSMAEAVQMLSATDRAIPSKVIYALSDLTEAARTELVALWPTIPIERRRTLVDRLIDASESDFNLDFAVVIRLALTDLDDELRESAVEATWADETVDMLNRLMPLASVDPSMGVRAAATSALGRFIYAAEVGSFPKAQGRIAENLMIRLWNNAVLDLEVRRRALESLSNSSRSEVLDMIKSAYTDRDPRMKASAVHAMGRSYDEQWTPVIIHELKSDDPMMQYEAAKAAGELELNEAVPMLGVLLNQDDREVMEMAVWSLGEIGGGEAKRYLMNVAERAEEEGDEELVEAVEEAIATANLVGGSLVG